MTERWIEIAAPGGPEVLQLREGELPPPGSGEVRMRNGAVGLNYIDTYHRSGLYPIALPGGIGVEAAGTIEAVGPGVGEFAPGDRVCTFGPLRGAYATAWNVPAAQLLRTPVEIDDATAAAILLKGATAEALIERCARVQPGWTVLVQAAAGGVGQLMVAWLTHIGATVIGTAGGAAKCARVIEAGASHAIDYGTEDVAARVRELTGGRGVEVVFDGVGQATWAGSLGAVARRGMIVSFGNASGPVTGVALGSLAAAGSIFVTRPTVFDYYADPAERTAGVARLFALVAQGVLRPEVGQTWPLAEAAEAHRALEGRHTTGSTLLLP
ncbi:MAG TPA: quinone oxidoreductase [Novosphingobium sp.]